MDPRNARPTVKALEWTHEAETAKKYETWSAETIFGRYHVVRMPAGYTWFVEGGIGSGGPFDTAEAAKTAAQADYERRILSALEAAPEPQQEARPQPVASPVTDAAKAALSGMNHALMTLPLPQDGRGKRAWSSLIDGRDSLQAALEAQT